MRTILIGKELDDMLMFEEKAAGLPYVVITARFQDGKAALQNIQKHDTDLVVLNGDLSDVNGIELGKQILELDNRIMLLYIDKPNDYLIEVLKQRGASILLKPYTTEEVRYTLESMHLLSKRKPKRIYARTFGHFDLFLDNKPIVFKSAKAKELLALLVDRQGGVVDSDQIIATLWSDRPKDEATQSLCSKLCKTLYQELEQYGIADLITVSRSNRSINTELLDSDLYDLLEGKEGANRLYYGEYMADYEWAEYRNYSLMKFI